MHIFFLFFFYKLFKLFFFLLGVGSKAIIEETGKIVYWKYNRQAHKSSWHIGYSISKIKIFKFMAYMSTTCLWYLTVVSMCISRWIVGQQISHSVSSNGEDIPGHLPSYQDPLKLTFGCKHYKRNCKLFAACCNQLYTCRHCHDEVADHSVDRYVSVSDFYFHLVIF
jgi:hypothetical protein